MRGACRLRIPWPRWAVEQGEPRGEMEHENYKAIERWADHLLSECLVACDGFVIGWHDMGGS